MANKLLNKDKKQLALAPYHKMIKKLKNKLKALALLDAIIEPEWEYRYFSYDAKWSKNQEMASMRDGCGGEWIVWFSDDIVGYKCISPEDGLMDNLQSIKKNAPTEYSEFINEPAFSMDMATCIWFYDDEQWVKHGKSVEWLIDLNNIIAWKAKDYHAWATEYYECEIDLTIVQSIFHGTINETLIKKLNPQIIMNNLLEETEEIGIVF